MAYQILDLDGKVLETLQSEEQVQELFDGESINAFWFDEGLAENLKSSDIEGKDIIRIVKRVSEE